MLGMLATIIQIAVLFTTIAVRGTECAAETERRGSCTVAEIFGAASFTSLLLAGASILTQIFLSIFSRYEIFMYIL